MRRWFLITAIRTAIGAFLVFLVWGIFVFYPAYTSKNTIRQQVGSSSQAVNIVQTAKKELQNLPQIDQVSIRQLHSFSNYTDQTAAAAKILNKLSISQNNPKSIFSISGSKLFKDTNKQIADKSLPYAIKQANPDIKFAAKLADYQSKTSKDLVNILEYDAGGDTAGFALGSDDTIQRLKLAQQGLNKTIARLKAAKGTYDDKSLDNLISLVSKMQQAREELSQTGDTSAWVTMVNQIQQDIIANREVFWTSKSGAVTSKLNQDADWISRAAKGWQTLAEKYKIH